MPRRHFEDDDEDENEDETVLTVPDRSRVNAGTVKVGKDFRCGALVRRQTGDFAPAAVPAASERTSSPRYDAGVLAAAAN